ncbi:betaine/proline/choline family ABC transporter ATP-binding protein [Bhargavaea cecembensis]|uniref:betaine/proline/choline family ABC transporter ATP-binding protein n=1 Tax=Bhargavaea cecembensis TaxID=394098 RepID=UPI000693276E|nr:betaine/proline/choline family ABC transporter ATP-binding protein [Bhargavaea cecembensis]
MLVFDNVSKVYAGGKRAVDHLNLEIGEGEFICFIGPSGCGKTTTMKMINRLVKPTEGKILLNGKNILEQNVVELRRNIGYVIQQIGLFPHMTIRDNIALVPRLKGVSSEERNKRAEELLELVNMPKEFLDRFPHELSGGQQQRIGVLRALASNPPLILMDEPFGALDPITRDSLQAEFKNLQQSLGKTIIFVTHDMDEAIKLADRIVIMRAGQIVQIGSPDEILRNPADDFVRDFIGKERLAEAQQHFQTVGQIMNPDPVSIGMGATLSEAVRTMRRRRVDSLLVTDDAGILRGKVTIEQIDRNRDRDAAVADLMEREVGTVRADTLLRDATRNILIRGSKYVPVVDERKRLIGIITRTNLVDVLYDSIWGEEEDEADTAANEAAAAPAPQAGEGS